MVEPDLALSALRGQALEEGDVLGRDHLLRPLRRQARAAGELIQRDLADHREVVVSHQADGRMLAGELHAGVRLGPIAHEIAQAPDLGGAAVSDRLEGRLERVPVAMDVRDDRNLHHCRVGTPLFRGRSTRVPRAVPSAAPPSLPWRA